MTRTAGLSDIADPAISDFLSRAEQRRSEVMGGLDETSQAAHGQFFTPVPAARLIVSMFALTARDRIRILDPGAGTGSLTAALVARLATEQITRTIEIVAVEKDGGVVPALADALDDCIALGRARDIKITTELVQDDLLDMHVGLRRTTAPLEQFDLIPMNPPYYKLPAGSRARLAPDGLDTPNIYSTFLLIAADLLTEGGQLSAITPRSFANGTYFKAFRRSFLTAVTLERIHLFDSRKSVFADGGVLQENVIFSATKAAPRGNVLLTVSHGTDDEATSRTVPYAEVVKPTDPDSFVRLPTSARHSALADVFDLLPCDLTALGVKASTGPVVDFRLREHIRPRPVHHSVPLLYPSNISGGLVHWPVEKTKDQAIVVNDETRKWLVPDERFVLVKRFSSKEERRRVVAAVHEPGETPHAWLGLDNKLNFIHTAKKGLPRDLAYGLALWLNSSLLDEHFRTFSGHTQVNVGDLKAMRYPLSEHLITLGAALDSDAMPAQEIIDTMVAEHIPGIAR
ncbi:Eco57I restriction-modification methylase domain-containing protein [Kineosporia sp. J2-2]|uniref:site-specific DNA-methyltransferase (adenine-specific) n=1 Tax=Kineosporia corallincola TaxID=2835133 RepID=A0ABS5TT83_9ACTN|nr:Eco57I restriction-modification methylase domain-containing protein [Kineosporia corallincola]MBT0774000.1 Eco57I restriction-modification methylase domain-containing protein [Kineosporia corallincola]